jgi:hypothetical protein
MDNYLDVGIPRRRRRHLRIIKQGGVWGTMRHLGMVGRAPTLFGTFYPAQSKLAITGNIPISLVK